MNEYIDESEPVDQPPEPVPMAQQLDDEEILYRYRIEKELMSIVSSGDRQRLKGFLKQRADARDFYSRMPENPMRIEKNLTIIINTILRLSAEKGGLAPGELHRLSETYALEIEKCRDRGELAGLRIRMIYNYCDAVYHITGGSRSAEVVKSIQYINRNLGNRITLKQLGDECGRNPVYLSRLFKKECRITVSEFIRNRRVYEAKRYLSRTQESITAIALLTGFEDPNYFSRTFTRVTGISPTRYRRENSGLENEGIPG